MPLFKHQPCCKSCVFAGSIDSPNLKIDVYVCTENEMVYIRDCDAPQTDSLLGTIDDLASDLKHSMRIGDRYIHAYLLASGVLNALTDDLPEEAIHVMM